MKKRPIAIELFAGAGGLSLGFEQAGFDVRAAVEIDPVHCAVHKFNFPHTTVLATSVDGLTGMQIRKEAGLGDAVIDCVSGGAPCQGFSMIGKRVLDDPRNRLAMEFLRIVRELDATSFVFENVKGLTVGKHIRFLNELVEAFREAGYECRMPWKVLNAAHFGTPQARERLILMGVKAGCSMPQYPAPLTNISGRPQAFEGLPYGPNCEDALGDLPDAESFDTLKKSDSVKTTRLGTPSSYAAELRGLANESWHFGYVREWDEASLTSSARTTHTEISRSRFAATAPGSVEPISRFFKLSHDGVANTLRAGTDGARGAFTSPRPIHYRYPRCVTVREMARLHGFPDWFRFNATKWHGARQIGNSVPPPLARAVAGEMIKALGYTPYRPEGASALGDTRLLEMDLSSASAHFKVPKMPSKRDRKSGATKRRQIDIERERLSADTDNVHG